MELGRKMLVPMSGKVEEVGVPRTHRPLKSAYSKIEQEEEHTFLLTSFSRSVVWRKRM